MGRIRVDRTCKLCGRNNYTTQPNGKFIQFTRGLCSRDYVRAYKGGVVEDYADVPSEPYSTDWQGYVWCETSEGPALLSHAVMRNHLERPLAAQEAIRHLNGDLSDVRLENLLIVPREGTDPRF